MNLNNAVLEVFEKKAFNFFMRKIMQYLSGLKIHTMGFGENVSGGMGNFRLYRSLLLSKQEKLPAELTN